MFINMKKGIIIAVIVVLVIGGFIYFVSGITSGNSVIKKYSYSGSVDEFISHVKDLSLKDAAIVTKITDTTGTLEKGYTYYISIELKSKGNDVLYSIACESSRNVASETTIELVMAYDKINNIGGYSLEAKGIEPLVNIFDANFIITLKNSQNLKISPL
jgi:hypothetical protein